MASSRHKELRLEFLAYHFPQTEAVGGDGDRLLLKYSPAYAAYKKLAELPAHFPSFPIGSDGLPTIHIGEKFCRLQGKLGKKTCGVKFTNRDGLDGHLHGVHGVHVIAPFSHEKYTTSNWIETHLRPAIKFYASIMKSEDYVGKGGMHEKYIDTVSFNEQVTSQPHGQDSDDVHDEESIIYSPEQPRKRKATSPRGARVKSEVSSESAPVPHTVARRSPGNARPIRLAEKLPSRNRSGLTREEIPASKPTSDLSDGASIIQNASSRTMAIDLSDDSEDDEEIQARLESLRVQREIKQIELEEMQLKVKLSSRKKIKHV